ncbi:MAG: YdeI/OmpD-associated family protein [Candidatus Dormiibacterota bacterium]
MKFRALIRLDGKTATGIEIPPAILARLGDSKRPAVTVTINDHTYRSTVGSMGGRYLIPVSADVRAKAGVQAGDTVTVELEADTQPRRVDVPEDFAHALARNAQARRAFEGLSYSGQCRHVLAIEGAKSVETRQRRIDKAIEELA